VIFGVIHEQQARHFTNVSNNLAWMISKWEHW